MTLHHPSEASLLSYAAGTLPAPHATVMRTHLAQTGFHRAERNAEHALDLGMRPLVEEGQPDHLRLLGGQPIECRTQPGGALRGLEHRVGLRRRLDHEHRFGASYARTLADWHDRFAQALPDIARLGLDERFRRLWRYYLAYCEGGFRAGAIDVGLYRLRLAEDTR